MPPFFGDEHDVCNDHVKVGGCALALLSRTAFVIHVFTIYSLGQSSQYRNSNPLVLRFSLMM